MRPWAAVAEGAAGLVDRRDSEDTTNGCCWLEGRSLGLGEAAAAAAAVARRTDEGVVRG